MITMLLNLLRYILIAAVLLTSNSQALMAVQLYLQPLVSAQTSVVEAGYDQQQVGKPGNQSVSQTQAAMPSCHQSTPKADQLAAVEKRLATDHGLMTLECEKDCNCCGGSCSSFAMTLDFPVAVPDSQLVEPTLSVHFSLQTRSELLQRPPISA